MTYRFTPDKAHYTLDGTTARIPPYWPGTFGRPIRYKGEDGYMGMTRVWAIDGERKLKQTLFWPLRVLHEAGI